MAIPEPVAARIRACAADAGIATEDLGELVHSWSNHVVMVGGRKPAVLRICYLGSPDRMDAEVALARELGADICAPRVIASGRVLTDSGDVLTWSVTHRLQGQVLSAAWPQLTQGQRHQAAIDTAGCLDRLYRHRPSDATIEALLAVPRYRDPLGGAILGWPLPRMMALLDDPRSALRHDQKERIADWINARTQLIPRVDQAELPVIHSDVHLSNIWWDGSRVPGLIDFEWARLADPVADLGRSVERAMADIAQGQGGPFPRFLDEVRAALPAWQVDQEQLQMSTLGYLVRQALLDDPLDVGPDHRPVSPAAPDHVTVIVDRLLALS